MGILLLDLFIWKEYQVDQDRPALPVERQGVFVITLAQHVCRLYPGHLFDGPVPGDHLALPVDHQGGIGQKVDDIGHAALDSWAASNRRAFSMAMAAWRARPVRKSRSTWVN